MTKHIQGSKKTILFLMILSGGVLLYFGRLGTQAYSSENTHPILAEQTARLFNQVYGQWLSDEEIIWLKQGAINEDQPPRWVNHFYDPTTGQGWNAQRMGSLPAGVVSSLSRLGLSSQEPLSAFDWSHNQAVQSRYSLYQGNRTFESAVFDFSQNNQQRAFQSLGHLLHLIADMSVPAHTRQDTHVDLLDDPGEPYEKWAEEQTQQRGAVALPSLNNLALNYQPICQSLDGCLVASAQYSNQNFFSEDTIFDKAYQNPEPDKSEKGIIDNKPIEWGYKKDYDNSYYKLFLRICGFNKWQQDLCEREFTIDKNQIHQDYWSRLSRQAVLAGVETIRHFKQATEQAKSNPPKPYEPPSAEVPASPLATPLLDAANKFLLSKFQRPTIPVFSPYGETVRLQDWASQAQDFLVALWQQSLGKTENFLSKLASILPLSLREAEDKEGGGDKQQQAGVIGDLGQQSGPSPTDTSPFQGKGKEKEGQNSQGKGEENKSQSPQREEIPAQKKEEEILGWQAEVADQSPDVIIEAGTGRDLSREDDRLKPVPQGSIKLWLELRNLGRAWQANQVSLNIWQITAENGTVNWQDVYDSSWLTQRRPAVIKQPLAAGQTAYLEFGVKTDQLPLGQYTLKFRPVYQDATGFHWLGQEIVQWRIKVAPTQEPPRTLAGVLPLDDWDIIIVNHLRIGS